MLPQNIVEERKLPKENTMDYDIIESIYLKRSGEPLSYEMIASIISRYVDGLIPDHQMSAWLATIACKGMTLDEVESLTRAYVSGGTRLSHPSLGKKVIDKHSTGGVGDKVTFIVVPIVAACGVPVTKISGRGLGHAGGTLDKLESIPGLKVDLSAEEFKHVINETGMVMTGQSGDLVPGDKATYQLRDITGSVESIPLIAASIISKKVATGADGLVLDVKAGSGALIQDFNGANELANIMVQLAKRFGIECKAVISDMSQPLGYAIGNTLEIKEAIEILKGRQIPGLTELSIEISRLMLQTAKPELTDDQAREQVAEAISSGSAYNKFMSWAKLQGAENDFLLCPDSLPSSQYLVPVYSLESGWIESIDPRKIGNAALCLGANREDKGSVIDHTVGIVIRKHIGDRVNEGDELAVIHSNSNDIQLPLSMIFSAFHISPIQDHCKPPPILLKTI